MIRAIAALCVVSVLASGRVDAAAPSSQPAAPETLVMPLDNPAHEPTLHWLAEGSAVLLAEYLERYGGLAVSRDERVAAFNRLQLPSAAALSHATVIKVAQIVGATEVVIGTYDLAGDELTVRARRIRLDTWHMAPEIVERGPLTDLFRIYEAVARHLRGAAPAAAAPAPEPGTLLTSLSAFEWYVKGLVAESAALQRSYLEQAAKAAPAEDRIKLAMWRVHTDAGNHELALAAAADVAASSLQSRAARYLAARSQIELRRYDDAFTTLEALQRETRLPEVLNALGVVQLRRGAPAQTGRPAYYFNQAAQANRADPDYFFNLGYAYWIDKDPPAAMYWLREAVRLDPADGDAHLVLAAALQQSGHHAEAARERELAVRLSGSRDAAGEVPPGLERLKEFLDRPTSRVNASLASADQRDQAELAVHHLDAGRRAFGREADREAEQELRRALYLSPYLAEAHLLLGRVYLRGGRPADAIQAFRIALWSEETVEGHVRLAEAYVAAQDLPAAREEVARALRLDPNSADALALRVKIGQ
jgi:tetratricopeptide (TPR) repeat protein